MESSAREAARKKANALLAERAAIVKVGVDECLKCTVEVPSEICHLCDQPAIMRNRGHCAACASFWIPALNRPGSLLLGPEFMHSSVVPYNKVTCDCGLELCNKWRRQTRAPCQRTATPLLVVFRWLSGGDQAAHARTCDSNFSLTFVRPFSTATREMNRGFWAGLRSRRSRLSSAIRLCGCPCGGSCGGPRTTRKTKLSHFMAMCAGKGSS